MTRARTCCSIAIMQIVCGVASDHSAEPTKQESPDRSSNHLRRNRVRVDLAIKLTSADYIPVVRKYAAPRTSVHFDPWKQT